MPLAYDPSSDSRRREILWREPPESSSYTGAALAGMFVGFLALAVITILLLGTRPDPSRSPSGLLSAVPTEAAFDAALSDALVHIEQRRPSGVPGTDTMDAWTIEYLRDGVSSARRLVAAHPSPARLRKATDTLLAALDRFSVAAGAARTCVVPNVDACPPQMDDLRDAAKDIDRSAGDLRLYAFGPS